MLEQDVKEITDQRLPAKNLKQALFAVGYAILSSLASFLAINSFGPNSPLLLIRVMIGLYYLLMVISGLYAFGACKGSLQSLQTNKNPRNYAALVIGGILLLGICRQVITHL